MIPEHAPIDLKKIVELLNILFLLTCQKKIIIKAIKGSGDIDIKVSRTSILNIAINARLLKILCPRLLQCQIQKFFVKQKGHLSIEPSGHRFSFY